MRVINKSLADLYPALIKSWHPYKNGILLPFDVAPKSHKHIWWKCSEGHEWEAMVSSRTRKNPTGCPYCSGTKATSDDNLATEYPELLKEWFYDRNDPLPEELRPSSNKKVWWKCKKGHEWEIGVCSRTKKNPTGCPYCSGRKATPDNNLAAQFPHLLKDWHYEKNKPLRPEDFLPKSHKEVWWKCKKGHEWETRIADRTHKKSGCPFCSGRRSCEDNCLETLFPELAKEWHPKKNGSLTPKDITAGTDKKVWWKCSEGHEWEIGVCSRTGKKPTGCPYCYGRYATSENNLVVVFPELIKEWNYEKNPLKPGELKPGSNKKVWWRCKNGHEWKISPNKRTGKDKTGCPYCTSQTSRLEIRVYCEFLYLFNDVKWRYKKDKFEIDVYVPKYLIGIEIDGYPWHLNKEEKDKKKGVSLLKHGIKLFRLRDNNLKLIENSDTFYTAREDDLFIVHRLLNKLLNHISFDNEDKSKILAYVNTETVLNEKGYKRFLSFLPSPPPEYSFAKASEKLVSEWHFEKNTPLIPENFAPVSGQKVWWKCKKGHAWEAMIYNRAKGSGCPYCAGKKVSSDNNLAFLFPELIQEWNYEKNLLKPEELIPGSNKKVWWKCKNGHEWKTSPTHRTGKRKTGCPYCSGHKVSPENNLAALFPKLLKEWQYEKNEPLTPETVAKDSKRKVWWKCNKGHEWEASIRSKARRQKSGCPYCDSLETLFPQIAKEWHFDKNAPLTPHSVTAKSGKKVWWKCSKGHEWEALVSNRTTRYKTGCPYCSGRFATKESNLAIEHPELLKEWHYEKNYPLKPEELRPASNKKVWWKCSERHEWETPPTHRTGKWKTGCPYCAGQKVSTTNSLLALFPNIAKEWNYNKNNALKPDTIAGRSGKKVWWKCSKGHEWESVVSNRTVNNTNCPYCAGRKGLTY